MNFFALSNEVPPDSLRSDSPPLEGLGEVKEAFDPIPLPSPPQREG